MEEAGTGTVLETVKPGSTTDHTDVAMTETVPSSMHEDLAIVTSAQPISLEPQLEITNESGTNNTEGNEQGKKEDCEVNEVEEDKTCEVEEGDVEIVDNVDDKNDKEEKDKGVKINDNKDYDELETIFKEDENDKEEEEMNMETIDNVDKNNKEEEEEEKDNDNNDEDYEEDDNDNNDDEDYEEENVKILSRSKSPKGKHICEICGKECPSRSKLLDHKVSHFDAKPFKCTIEGCQSSFKRKRQLDSHINAFHFGVRPYKCTEAGCTCTFFTTSALKTHMKMHARSLACPYEGCGATFHKKTQLRAHMSAEHTKNPGKPYSCSTCGKSFSYPSQLERHEVKHATIDHLCAYDDCGFVAPTFKELREHINMYHLNVHGENVRCPECGKEVTRAWYPQHLKKHSTKTLQSFQCTVPGCTKVYNSKKSLRAHLNASHSDHKVVCPVCSAEFAYKVSMVKHVKRVHQDFDVSSLSPQPSSSSLGSLRLGVKRDAIIARAASCDSIALEAKRFCASSSDGPVNDSTNVSSSSGMITITSTSNTIFHNTNNNTNFNDGINFSMNGSANDTNISNINKPNSPSPNTDKNSTNSIACKISGISQKRALIISQ